MNAGRGKNEKQLEQIVHYISAHPGTMRSALMRRHKLMANEATAILQTLEERGMVRKETRGRGHAYWIT